MGKRTNRVLISWLSFLIIATTVVSLLLPQSMMKVFAQEGGEASPSETVQSTEAPSLDPNKENTEEPTGELTEEPPDVNDQDPDPTETPSPIEATQETPISPTDPADEIILDPTETPTVNPTSTEEPIELAPLMMPAGGEIIPDEYIVVLKPKFRAAVSVQAVKNQVEASGGRVNRVFNTVLNGYSMKLPPQALEAVRKNPNVEYIEAVQVFTVNEEPFLPGSVQTDAVWGLDRIDQRDLPLNGEYQYQYNGSGVSVYIVDSGILYSHAEFGGRAFFGFDSFTDGRDGLDCNGHGTHVSGIVGGQTYGVAKAAGLFSVRVFDCSGYGNTTTVVAGLDWIAEHHSKPAVVNMSLGGGASPTVDKAVNNLIISGVMVVVAAGNYNTDACNYSPARVPNAITVGATTSNDTRSNFSNWGSCLDIFAPGSSIQSAWITSDTASAHLSGTSMSAPYAAGVAALYLQANPAGSVSQVTNAIITSTTPDKIGSVGSGSPNRLLYSALTSDEPIPIPDSPGLDSPADGFYFNPPINSLILKWHPVLYGDSFGLQIATTSTFTIESIVFDFSALLETTYTDEDFMDLPGGRYFWRVRAANVNNEYGPWSASRNFVVVSLPSAPQLVSPANASYINLSEPELNWTGDANSLTYHLQVSSSSTFSSAYIMQEYEDLSIPIYVLTSLPDRKYFWRVRAANSNDEWGPWSATRYFIIDTQSTVPRSPLLLSPSNGSFTNNSTLELSWLGDANAVTYHLQVSSTSRFSRSYILYEYNDLSSSNLTLTNLPDRKYFWRVRAANTNDEWGPWSVVQYFKVDTIAPLAPQQVKPADGIEKIGIPLFKWGASSGASFYQFAYNTSGNPEDEMLYTSDVITKRKILPPEMPLMQWLYWFVKAGDKAGNWSVWSTPYSVRITLPVPRKPSLVLPENKTPTNDTTPTLNWNEVDFGVDYHVQISNSALFLTIVEEEEELGTSFTPSTPLNPDGRYYWRVRARNADEVYGKWSRARVFVVDTEPPPAPVLVSPVNGKENTGIPTFSWKAALGAKYYRWAYSTNPLSPADDPLSVISTSSYLTNRYFKPAAMDILVQYYWFVQAKDRAGNEGDWSEPFAIKVLPPKPARPTLSSPVSGYQTEDFSLTLSWNTVAYGNQYQIQIDNNYYFTSPNYEYTSALYAGSHDIGPLEPGKWYWRVRAVNAIGDYGSWSSKRYFKIQPLF